LHICCKTMFSIIILVNLILNFWNNIFNVHWKRYQK
jgi:hypothetical protein